MVLIITDVAKNLGMGSCTEHTAHGNNFELILRVKMETRHPVVGSLDHLVVNFGRSVIIV